MGTNKTPNVANAIAAILDERGQSYAWLAKTAGISYKKLLRQVKHQKTPLALDQAFAIASALNMTVPELVHRAFMLEQVAA